MLARWLTKLETVHAATTREEREAIYRFRYTVYVEELGRILGGADHDKKTVCDRDDEQSFSHHLYTGSTTAVTGSVRIRAWGPGEVPKYDFDLLSMSVFPGLEHQHIAELGRLMIRPTMRGKLVLPSLARAVYEFIAGNGCDLAFCYCAPGLVPHYRKLGFRPYAAPLVPTVDGMHVALVAIPSDVAYLKRMGSPTASLVKNFFGPGKRAPIDMTPLRELLDVDAAPIEVDPERVWGEVQDEFLRAEQEAPSFLESLPEKAIKKLTSKGFVIEVKGGTLVTKKGYGEREVFIVLDGIFEVVVNERRLALLGKGELFGEVAFFLEQGKRSADVRATTDGRLLVLRRRFLDELMDSDPGTAAQILLNLGRILAERLANTIRMKNVEATPDGDEE